MAYSYTEAQPALTHSPAAWSLVFVRRSASSLSPACSLCRDYPNAWPPLNHMIIEGLATSIGDPRAPALASDLAVRYLRNVYTTYYATGGLMSEKLDAAQPGTPGGGGEYKPQVRVAVRLHGRVFVLSVCERLQRCPLGAAED